ncbi:MAG: hypothetical protein OHK0022_42250 [Roseiflexaceae bacterium]
MRGIERREHLVIFPFLLRALYEINSVLPGPVRWLAAVTGARRPKRG